ncbi:glycerate kinase [Actinomadura fulvescens]|uniref:Glycerate kinase n=1 Tax=Actinomadura fulvescens TaxID=46160 RepID=A0ABP6D7W6_9ACTN
MSSILIAPDKFKGCLSADKVADALAEGVSSRLPDARVHRLPLADGGEGSAAAARAAGFAIKHITVTGPDGRTRTAPLASRGGTVLIEAAAICGLATSPAGARIPLRATTLGVGEAIRIALIDRPDTIVLAVGGVATTDGGAGMLQALGARLTRADGTAVKPGGGGLAELTAADLTAAIQILSGIDLVLAVDVDNPLLGPHGTAAVYGPQKGAGAAEVAHLERSLGQFIHVLEHAGVSGARRAADTAGAGAAGGLGFAGLSLGARLRSGADHFLALLGAEGLLARSDLAITGEGSLDQQTLSGKLPVAFARHARRLAVPVHAVAGRCTLTAQQAGRHFRSVQALTDLTDLDPAHDGELSARLLRRCGQTIADRYRSESVAHDEAYTIIRKLTIESDS